MIINITLDTSNAKDELFLETIKAGIIAAERQPQPGPKVEVEVEPDIKPAVEPKDDEPKKKPAAKKKKKPAAKKAAKPEPEPVAEPEVTVSGDTAFVLDDVRSHFRDFATDNMAGAQELLGKFDAKRLSDIPEEKWGEFIAAMADAS